MATIWEFVPDFDIGKDIQVFNTRRDPVTGAYGPEFLYDEIPPSEIVTLQAHGMPLADVLTWRTRVLTPGYSTSFTTKWGITFTGMPLKLRAQPIGGLDPSGNFIFNATLIVRRTDLI